MPTSVPPIQFTSTGLVIPTESEILAGVQADINSAFGGNLDPSLETPQGQIASSQTAIIADKDAQIAQVVNEVNPDFSDGVWQDAIGTIYFIDRIPGQGTILTVAAVGVVNTVIPVGSTITDGTNQYTSTVAQTIPITGTVNLSFTCNTLGPVAIPSSVKAYQTIAGVDTLTVVSGIVGRNVETRFEFEARRIASVAGNANQIAQSVLGNVLSVTGVIDAYVYDNAGIAATVGGVPLNANSLYVCVAGGNSLDVATAIWQKKGPGCGYTGNTTVTVTDTNSGYSAPYPDYSVTYQVPTDMPFMFAVNIANSISVPSNALVQIQAAIVSSFSGNDGRPRARIGSQVFASRFYANVAAVGSWVNIRSIMIGSINTPSASITGSISGNTLTVTATASGTIAIGQTLMDTTGSIIPGTTITAGSGTSWTVSNTQTVASEAIELVLAASDSQQANIDQIPTLDANNITLSVT